MSLQIGEVFEVFKSPQSNLFLQACLNTVLHFLLGSIIYEPLKNYFFAAAKKMNVVIGSRINTTHLTLTTFINNPLNVTVVGFSGWI